jgi:NAD(P)-dependent dehydrogenase (short-subunit alcohol dehydrogenase family)
VSLSVFVTGGSRGLGLAIARLHLTRGDRVALLARGRERLEAAARELGAEPGRVSLFPADVRDAEGVREALAAYQRQSGSIDRLYANAGAIETGGAESAFDRGVFETNFYGVVNAVEGWLATSPPRGAGVGIISSFSAFRGLPHVPAYGAAKAAVTLYAESLRGRLRPSGRKVSTIFLGYLDTELTSSRKPSMFVTSVSTASGIVVGAVDRGATSAAYPLMIRAAVFATRCLPDSIYDRLVARRYRSASS